MERMEDRLAENGQDRKTKMWGIDQNTARRDRIAEHLEHLIYSYSEWYFQPIKLQPD